MNRYWTAIDSASRSARLLNLTRGSSALRAATWDFSDALNIQRELRRIGIDDQAQNSLSHLGRVYSEMARTLDSGALRRLSGHMEQLSRQSHRQFASLGLAAEALSEAYRQLHVALPYYNSAVQAARLSITHSLPSLGVLGTASRLSECVDQLSQFADEEHEEILDAFPTNLANGLVEAAKRAPESPQMRLAWIGILITIVLFLWSQYSNHMIAERASAKAQRDTDELAKLLYSLNNEVAELRTQLAETESRRFYLAIRSAPLLSRPRSSAKRFGWLPAGESVWLDQRKGRWVHVRYINSLTGLEFSGWTRKKYLKRLP